MTDDLAALLAARAELAELTTEQRHPDSYQLGTMDAESVIAFMHAADEEVPRALAAAAPQLAEAARHVASAIESGHRLVLLGAGTGGRLAIQEVSELPPTFGIDADAAIALVASRAPVGPAAIAQTEDDLDAAPRELRKLGVGAGDAVIGVAASGQTPFVLAGVRAAHQLGAWTAAIANNPHAPLLAAADLAILLDTGPEVLTGSTRLKAGTAQKVALNRITTASMVLVGRVTANHMTHVRARNSKLRARAVGIVADLLDVTAERAAHLLQQHGWDVADTVHSGQGM
jgi:N-acetylmuramic acid 6-phosphate etherase